jgi:hypothetical protein
MSRLEPLEMTRGASGRRRYRFEEQDPTCCGFHVHGLQGSDTTSMIHLEFW